MRSATQIRCAAHGLLAVAALVFTTVQLGPYLPLGLLEGNVQFWRDTLVNPASRFITIDIFFVFVVVWSWMLTEARRWNMGHVGWYMPAALLVSFSATLPVFMIHREVAMARHSPPVAPAALGLWARVSLLASVCTTLGFATWAWPGVR